MKRLYSCLIILTFFASCTYDGTSMEHTNITNRGIGEPMPLNSDNPYDGVGQVYDELFSAYYDGSTLPTSTLGIISRVTTLANSNSSFVKLNSSGCQPLDAARVQYLTEIGIGSVGDVIGNTKLTPNAKTDLTNFVNIIVGEYNNQSDATVLYDVIIKYESEVMNNSTFTSNDKKIILSTTSIVRHSAYRLRKKPKKNTDPDWILFVAHVAAAIDGADENEAKAVVEGLAVGIASNK